MSQYIGTHVQLTGAIVEYSGTIDAIAFDKTGTLTEGKPKVSDIEVFKGSKEELLALAYTLENYSTHPIAKTIVRYAQDCGIQPYAGESFQNLVGRGVQAHMNGDIYYAGNLQLFKERNIPLTNALPSIEQMQKEGKTIVIIGNVHDIIGVISVADSLRSSTINALHQLKQSGVDQLAMLTGDHEGTAKLIAKETDINRYFAELLPEDKVTAIQQLQEEGHHVAMVGDGINDAPALATADLGIAMGGAGTDTAMETADIVLMADNLEKLPYTMKLSKRALTIIKQNIWFSIVIKLIALILIFPGWLTLWLAVLSDTGAALIVILNALRLLRVKK